MWVLAVQRMPYKQSWNLRQLFLACVSYGKKRFSSQRATQYPFFNTVLPRQQCVILLILDQKVQLMFLSTSGCGTYNRKHIQEQNHSKIQS